MSDRLHTESAETLATNNGTTAPQAAQVTEDRAAAPRPGGVQQHEKCILPPVARLILSRSITALLPVLCLLQLALWSFDVIALLGPYWAAFKAFDIIGIAALLITLGFYITVTVQSIYGLVALCRREHRTHLATFNTMLCFMTLVAALRVILPEHTAYFAPFAPSFFLDALGVMMVIYALVRLTEEDLRRRRCAVICSAVALAAVWVLFCRGAGNFAVIVLKSGETLSLEELNLFRFLQAAATDIPLGLATSAEESLVYLIQIGDYPELLLPLLTLSVLLADLLPFAALSAVGYFVYGIAGRTDEQYLHLRVAARFNVTLTVAAAMALISAVIQLIVGVVQKDIGYNVVLSLQNIALTLALLLTVAVATTIPYRIYSMHYKRQFAAFQKMKEEA